MENDSKVISLGEVKSAKRKSRSSKIEDLTPAMKQDMISHYIDNTIQNPVGLEPDRKFVCLSPDNIQKLVYEIVDGEVLPSDEEAVLNMLGSSIKDRLVRDMDLHMTAKQYKDAVSYWRMKTEIIPEPKMIAWKDEDCLSYRKLPFNLGMGDTPLFDEMMSRITNSTALMSFIGSLMFSESYNQQYVWIQGEGGDGKSSLMRVLDKALAHICDAKSVPKKENDNFWAISLVGKRLAIFSDCSNTQWVTSGMFKSLTGGDAQSLEGKFKNSKKGTLQTKFIFTSNEKPALTTEKADYRRIIYCEIKRFTNDYNTKYDDLLFKEAGYFFSKCASLYQSLCPNHEVIPADYSQILNQMSVTEEPYEAFFDKYFLLSELESVTPSDYYSRLKYVFRKPKQQAEFRQWLKKTHKIEKTSVPGKTDYEYKGMRLKPGSIYDGPF